MREENFLSQQGAARYTSESKAIKPVGKIYDEDREFEFDTDMPSKQHYFNY